MKKVVGSIIIFVLISAIVLAATEILPSTGFPLPFGIKEVDPSDAAAGRIFLPGAKRGQGENSTGIGGSGKPVDGTDKPGSTDGTGDTGGGAGIDGSEGSRQGGGAVYLINEEGTTVADRIKPPEGFEREELEEGSFGEFLRNLPLRPHGTRVRYYDGRIKPWDVHAAVIDMDVGDRDLQQCADAVIRLRAEYLYSKGLYDRIHFNFTNGFNAEYKKWMEGYRIRVSGNEARWVEQESRDASYGSFRKYLDVVFTYAGTLSLSQEMDRIDADELQPGDVFLRGGSPGHCVIVVDMAVDPETGRKVFLIAQSYMPAQDIHILKNPAKGDGDPWYPLDFGDTLVTPEWMFTADEVYRFPGGDP